MNNLLWISLKMFFHGYYPMVFVKPYSGTNQIEIRFESTLSPEQDRQFGEALINLGKQMKEGKK